MFPLFTDSFLEQTTFKPTLSSVFSSMSWVCDWIITIDFATAGTVHGQNEKHN